MTSPYPTPRIFVSHSSKDSDFGIPLVEDLRSVLGDESAVWYDSQEELQGGDTLPRKIVEELTACPVFIVILSPEALASPQINAEIDLAWRQKLSESGKLILPILYRPCQHIREDLQTLQVIRFLPPKSYKTVFTELLVALGLPTTTKSKDYVRSPKDPARAIIWQMISQIEAAFVERDWPMVVRKVKYLLKQAPTAITPTLYRMQGHALLAEGEVQLAQEAFNAATIVSEQRLAEGNTYLSAKQYKKAIAIYDRVIAWDPNLAVAYSNKGLALYSLKRYEEALTACQQAIHLDPNLAIAYFNQGLILEKMEVGRWGEANQSFEKARQLGYRGQR